ncbi:hypothetical protein [Xenorhabdus ehlersii]|uniref:Uncharacterized protein n=1 Tax=Xenorhabdus ehlersii TaxID=290111 RepID=A0A2D0IMH0_9GAMM|nr:hypothetical protein [Xenorhabdus ehlersii]PHM22987.1 hypothetical protein Xehl_03221 [Xenorhabdus ehlersii]RKE92655.1 hypothetical protein BDE27_0311 [Xenorhabdus ehlersii]
MSQDYIDYLEQLDKLVRVDETHIILNTDPGGTNNEYEILLQECGTPEQILWWTFHLTEKNWVTTDMLRRFIRLATVKAKIKID